MGLLLYTIYSIILVSAEVKADESVNQCNPSSYTELVKCAEKKSLDINLVEQQLQSTRVLEDVAQQWINPDLEIDRVWKGSEKSETTASMLFTLRLGGKKTALVNEAKAEVEKAQADRDLSVNQIRLEIMLTLYRLAHLKSEIKLEQESGETFAKIINQYEKRAALSPEQNVSLGIFKMALADHKLKLTRLRSDQNRLFEALVSIIGISRDSIDINLPARKENWPKVEKTSEVISSPQIRQVIAELKIAKSQKEKADGDSWPDLKIGPSVRTTKDKNESNTFVGVGLSFPIPIFTTNSGNRAYRANRVVEAELAAEQSKRKIQATRNALLNQYNQIVGSLQNNLSTSKINEKHHQLEKQFFKGLVSSALVIEAHRQLFDLEERRNSSELQAVESYGQLLIIDNMFGEVIL